MTRRYSLPSILLHWTMALAIGVAWIIGQIVEELPRGAGQASALGLHALVGLGVAALLLPRLLARLFGGTPDAAAAPAWEARLAAAAHLLLYVLMLAVPLTGLAIAMTGRAPFSVLGLCEIPPLLRGIVGRGLVEDVHGFLANLMAGTVALHVAATLWHVLVRRDGVAGRMLPRLRS